MSDKTIKLSDAEFEGSVLKSQGLALVDFWAEWCGPCRAIAPTLDAIANEQNGKLKVFKVNVDDNPSTPQTYGVRGIPTLLLFKDGQVVDRLVGAHPKDRIADMIAKHS